MSNHNMGSIKRRRKRQSLLRRDGSRCPVCGAEFSDENPATVAHLLARADGGSNALTNLGLLCLVCQSAGIDHPAAITQGDTSAA